MVLKLLTNSSQRASSLRARCPRVVGSTLFSNHSSWALTQSLTSVPQIYDSAVRMRRKGSLITLFPSFMSLYLLNWFRKFSALALFPSKIAGAIPVMPPEEGFPVGAVVVVLTDIVSGSRGNVPWSVAVHSSPVVITLSNGVRSGTFGGVGGSMFIGWWVLVSSAVWADTVLSCSDSGEESNVPGVDRYSLREATRDGRAWYCGCCGSVICQYPAPTMFTGAMQRLRRV